MKGAVSLPSGNSGLDKNVQAYHSSQRTLSAPYYSVIGYSSTETWHVSSPSSSHISVHQDNAARWWTGKKGCQRLGFAAVGSDCWTRTAALFGASEGRRDALALTLGETVVFSAFTCRGAAALPMFSDPSGSPLHSRLAGSSLGFTRRK